MEIANSEINLNIDNSSVREINQLGRNRLIAHFSQNVGILSHLIFMFFVRLSTLKINYDGFIFFNNDPVGTKNFT